MKIHEISDLHLEAEDYDLENMPDADVLILAGDILRMDRLSYTPFMDQARKHFDFWSQKYKNVIVIDGNHEYYRTSLPNAKRYYKKLLSKYSNIHRLDNDIVVIDETRFIGSTLWTNFRNRDPMVELAARQGINDFRIITDFGINDCVKQNDNAVAFLNLWRQEDDLQNVVVTHFSPSYRSIHPRWGNDPCNYYFSNDLERLFKGVDIWFHGHTHDSFDYLVDKTRIICNPKGYGPENKQAFNPKLIVDTDEYLPEHPNTCRCEDCRHWGA